AGAPCRARGRAGARRRGAATPRRGGAATPPNASARRPGARSRPRTLRSPAPTPRRAPAGGSAGVDPARRELLGLVRRVQRLEQLVHVAVQDRVELVEREPDAVIGQAVLREVVGADALGSIARAHHGPASGRLLGGALGLLLLEQARLED